MAGFEIPHDDAPASKALSEQPDVPVWAIAAGFALSLVFAGLVIQTYSGISFRERVTALLPWPQFDQLIDTSGVRVFYVSGGTVSVGQLGVGERGQDHPFQPGDQVLLGASHRLVRLGPGGRLIEIRPAEGSSIIVMDLGAWDQERGRLTGITSQYIGGSWVFDVPLLQPVGAPLHDRNAPAEELTGAFRLIPLEAGRVRRTVGETGPSIRIRPNGRGRFLAIEGGDTLPTLDNVVVTVQATVRSHPGVTVELTLADVVDAFGTVQATSAHQVIEHEDEWLTLRVQRRVVFPSINDRYSIGLLDVLSRDWLEIGDLSVYLGALP